MIASIRGKIIDKAGNSAVIEAGSVGYLVYLPASEAASVKIGQEALFYTHLVVKEEALDFYGSQDKNMVEWFRMLLQVKGVGPKSALAIISKARPSDLAVAIQSGSPAILQKVGVNPKMAERVVMELKGKAKEMVGSALSGQSADKVMLEAEVMEAMESLGYSSEQARQAVAKAEGDDMQSKVRSALRMLGK